MLPDFPDIKNELNEMATDFIRDHSKETCPVLGMIGTTIQHEGNKGSYETVDGEEIQINYNPFEGIIEIPFSEAISLSLDGYLAKLKTVADDMSSQMSQQLYQTLNESCEKAGTATNAKGNPFSFELYLESLEKIDIEFDEATGKPIIPTLVVAPAMGEKLKHIIPEWFKDENKNKKMEDVLKIKHKEWCERETRRKLVD